MSAHSIKQYAAALALLTASVGISSTAAAAELLASAATLWQIPLMEKFNNLISPSTPLIAVGGMRGGAGARGFSRSGGASSTRSKMGRSGHTYSHIAVQGRLRYSNHSNGYAFKMRSK